MATVNGLTSQGTLQLTGLSSGIDSASIISKLIEVEQKPVQLLQAKKDTFNKQDAAFVQLNTLLQKLETASKSIDTGNEFIQKTGSFTGRNGTSDSAVAVEVSSAVQEGTVDIEITQLAKAQRSISNFGGSTASGAISVSSAGLFSLSMNGNARYFTVDATKSLINLRDEINNSGLDVTASVLNLGTSANPDFRLVVDGNSTGAANVFEVGDPGIFGGGFTFDTTQAAQNAQVTINGTQIERSTNEITDAITGASITLKGTGEGVITFEQNNDAVFTEIQNFVGAYNDVMSFIGQQFTFDKTNNTTGDLFGNSAVRTIQQQLRSIVSSPVSGLNINDSTIFSSLSQVGIKSNADGNLEITESTLRDAIQSNLEAVANLFIPSGSATFNSSSPGTITFIDATGKTTPGTYQFRVNGGVLELFDPATGDYVPLDQSGNFFSGPTGSSFEGLLLRTGNLLEGSTGTLNITVGIAAQTGYNTGFYTEFSHSGLIFNQRTSLETSIKQVDDQISSLNDRITKKEDTLKQQFSNLEVLLSRLQSQQSFLTGQLANLGNVFTKKS